MFLTVVGIMIGLDMSPEAITSQKLDKFDLQQLFSFSKDNGICMKFLSFESNFTVNCGFTRRIDH